MRSLNRDLRFRAAALLLVGGLVATGCTSKDDEPTTPAAGEPPTVSVVPTPTQEPTTPVEGTPTAEPSPGAPVTTADRLLPTDAVPGLNATWQWQDGVTGPAPTDPFGLCQKADLLSIGASSAVQRTYFPPVDTDDNAAEQVADFPDAKTAVTAEKVLLSWRKKCAEEVVKATPRIGAVTAVPVSAGTGSWYLVSVLRKGEEETRFHAFGIVRSGKRIAVLRIDSGGQDYNYPAGQEPMVGMVKAAAALLQP
ncbi:MAG: hypothetical protein JWQ74_2113 [Marmoricola sp.]|nr:hypothetical protein [Marmoricola sp.]